MADRNKMNDMSVNKLMIQMGIPMILSMALQAVYNIVDSAFVGNMREGSEAALNALTLVFPVQMLMVAVGIGTGVGTNALLARTLGQGNSKKAAKVAGNSLFLGVIIYVVCLLFAIFGVKAYISSQTVDAEVLEMGVSYLQICCVISFGIIFFSLFEKLLQATGRSLYSTIGQVVGAVVNIILDPILIFGLGPFPRLGIEGAAIATGIGQCSTLLIYLLFYIIKKPPVKIHRNLIRPEKKICARLYGVGIPAALNMALPSLLISALNAILASISETGVTILGIYYKLQTFLYLSVNGMIQGMRPIIGYNYGAKEYKRVNKIYNLALMVAFGIMAVGTALFMFTPETFMKMFTTQPSTITAGASALRIISCGFIVSSVSVVSSGALEGLGKGNESLAVSLLRYLIIIVPLAFVLSQFSGVSGVWHSFWITEAITAIISYIIYKKALLKK